MTTGTLCSAPPWNAGENKFIRLLLTSGAQMLPLKRLSPPVSLRGPTNKNAYFDAEAQTASRLSSQYNRSVL